MVPAMRKCMGSAASDRDAVAPFASYPGGSDDAASTDASHTDRAVCERRPKDEATVPVEALSCNELRAGQILQTAHQLRGVLAGENITDLNALRELLLESVETICEKANDIRIQAARAAGNLSNE